MITFQPQFISPGRKLVMIQKYSSWTENEQKKKKRQLEVDDLNKWHWRKCNFFKIY